MIRRRRGKLWIWASADGWPFGTTEPPGAHQAEYDHGGLLFQVDRAIVPPDRWVIREAPHQQWLLAW